MLAASTARNARSKYVSKNECREFLKNLVVDIGNSKGGGRAGGSRVLKSPEVLPK